VSLSVLCPTRDPAPQVAALLQPLREVADEIVVAVDSRVAPELVGGYAAAADRVLRFHFGGPNRALAWLHEQCRGDWVLWIGGDEVVSRELIDLLPRLVRTRRVLQYWLPVRWLFPDAGHWLREVPWFPDFHNRLARNDATLRFSGLPHTDAVPALPARWLDAPIYHLDLVLRDEAERARKAADKERAYPGLIAPGGGPLNEVYYLPERSSTGQPVAVPDEDRALIDAVLGADEPVPSAPVEVPLGTEADVESAWAQRRLGPDAYRARLELVESEVRMAPSEHRALHVRIANEGDERLPWGLDQPPLVRIGYRLGDGEGPRAPLPCELGPRESLIAPVPVVAPPERGVYRLEIDLVHEGVRWFGRPLVVDLRVEALRSV
jgi:hypothetical protein